MHTSSKLRPVIALRPLPHAGEGCRLLQTRIGACELVETLTGRPILDGKRKSCVKFTSSWSDSAREEIDC